MALVAASLGLGCGGSPPSSEKTAGGDPAPDFELTALDGQTVRLSGYQGRVVLLDFWATWCGPCRAELPHLKSVRAAYADRGFEIIGVSLDDAGPEVVRSFIAQEEIPYPVVLGGPELADQYGGIEVIPTAFLIDREGRIVSRIVGYKPEAQLRSQIEPLL